MHDGHEFHAQALIQLHGLCAVHGLIVVKRALFQTVQTGADRALSYLPLAELPEILAQPAVPEDALFFGYKIADGESGEYALEFVQIVHLALDDP